MPVKTDTSLYQEPPIPNISNIQFNTNSNKESKTARMSIVLSPSKSAEWRNFCAAYGISLNAGVETAITIYMDAVRDQYPVSPAKIV